MVRGNYQALSKFRSAGIFILALNLLSLLVMWGMTNNPAKPVELIYCKKSTRLFQYCRKGLVRTLQRTSGSPNPNNRPTGEESNGDSEKSQSQDGDTPAGVLIGVGVGVFLLIVGIVWCVSKRQPNQIPQPPAVNSASEPLENKVKPLTSSVETNYFYGEPPAPTSAIFSTNQEQIDNLKMQVIGLVADQISRDSPCPPIEFLDSEANDAIVKDPSPQFTMMTLYRSSPQQTKLSGGWTTTKDTEIENLPEAPQEAQGISISISHNPYKIPANLLEINTPESTLTESEVLKPQKSINSVRLMSVVVIPVEQEPADR